MKYSFIILIDDEKKLENKLKEISSIKDLQIILIGEEKYKEKYSNYEYYIDNIENYSKSLNKILSKIKGKYINFSLSNSIITKKDLKNITNIIESTDSKIYAVNEYKKFLGVKLKKYNDDYLKISINDNYSEFTLNIDGYFFNKNIIKNKLFNEKLENMGLVDYVIKIINENKNYIKIYNSHVCINNAQITDYTSKYIIERKWYFDYIKYVQKLLKDNSDNYYIQNISYYLILIRFMAVTGKKTNVIKDELPEFFDLVKNCLTYISDDIILNFSSDKISKYNNNIFMDFKNENYYEELKKNHLVIENLGNLPIVISAINNEKDTINFDCSFNCLKVLDKNIKIITKFNNKEIKIHQNYVYSDTRFFGVCFNKKYTFDFKIKKEEIKNNSKLKFYLTDGEETKELKIEFDKPQSRFSNSFPHGYYLYSKKDAIYKNQSALVFKKVNFIKKCKQELKLYYDFLTKSSKKLSIVSILIRLMYYISKPFYKNVRIWITNDKLYKGGDNGEYFYQYCYKKNKDNKSIRCYYVISKDAYDYKRLKKQKYVLKFKSLKSLIIALNSECVFATHANAIAYIGFSSKIEKYFRDLFNFDIFCIQHGVSIGQLTQSENRLRINTKLYFVSGNLEYTNMEQKEYDYKDYNYIKKTGSPRYDGLVNKEKKQILITPTWRREFANEETNTGSTRKYYDEFKKTIYFKIYNDLINNKKLIDVAKENGYEILFLLHPTLTSQAKDFKSDYVKILTATEENSYEKLLTESSLMVTDYSGVQFDFAYMKKPILYFHPSALPPYIVTDIFDYEKDAFGPIIKTTDELVNELCNKIKNGCKNEEKYIKRANKFFIYDDFNNCKRVYDEAIKFFEERNNNEKA